MQCYSSTRLFINLNVINMNYDIIRCRTSLVHVCIIFPQGVSDTESMEASPGGLVSKSRESEAMSGYPWYFGKKSRIEAEQALHKMKDGVFVIRESDVRDGEYAIALKWAWDVTSV